MGNIFHKLAEKMLRGSATEAERRFMDAYYDAFDNVQDREDVLTVEEQSALGNRINKGIRARIGRKKTVRFRKRLPYTAAAAILAVVGGTWLLFSGDRQEALTDRILVAEEVLPGGNRARLTLANGQTVDLSEQHTGIVVGEELNYTDGSAVFGEQATMETSEPVDGRSQIQTLTTPKGGTYQIKLSDGTKVWLNAASTLRYPNRFSDDERVVELEGEAYFNVRRETPDIRHQTPAPALSATSGVPFKVITNGQTVEVLGTEFNISAYPGEDETKTTLVEGSVRVSNLLSQASNLLRPGEQAVVSGSTMEISQVNVAPYTAWKDGFFYFDNVLPREAIAQIARWYDLDVLYEGTVPATFVFGMVDRTKPLSAVLNAFAKSGLSFEVKQEGSKKQLIVLGK